MPSLRLARGRHSAIGAIYTVTCIVRDRRAVFIDAPCVDVLRHAIAACDTVGATSTHAWVAMPDHLHWIFELRCATLGSAVQRMKSVTARNLRNGVSMAPAVWQRGYYDHRIRDEADHLLQLRYVQENPVRAGLVDRMESYPHAWSRWRGPL